MELLGVRAAVRVLGGICHARQERAPAHALAPEASEASQENGRSGTGVFLGTGRRGWAKRRDHRTKAARVMQTDDLQESLSPNARLFLEEAFSVLRAHGSAKFRFWLDRLSYEEKVLVFFEASISIFREHLTAENRVRFERMHYKEKVSCAMELINLVAKSS